MRCSFSRGRVLVASLLGFLCATFPGGQCLADDQPIKWRARPFLEIYKSSTNCGIQLQEPFNIEFNGRVLKTSAWSWTTYDMTLLEPLNPDGSGQVYAISMPHQRSVVLKFEAGTGPRSITYWHRYNARCFWKFIPTET
jgi:hypothetical protein